VNIDFQPRPAPPSSLRNWRLPRPGRAALSVDVHSQPFWALSFSFSHHSPVTQEALQLLGHQAIARTLQAKSVYRSSFSRNPRIFNTCKTA
jgi:hypothetical protein